MRSRIARYKEEGDRFVYLPAYRNMNLNVKPSDQTMHPSIVSHLWESAIGWLLRELEHDDRNTAFCIVCTSKESEKAVADFQRLYPEHATWQYVSFLVFLWNQEETSSDYEERTITVDRQVAQNGFLGEDSITEWEDGQTSQFLRILVPLPWDVITPGASEVTMEPTEFVEWHPLEAQMISDAVHQATSDRDKFNESTAEHCLMFSDWMLEQ